MALLIAFAFIAGAATAVSPCVLPVLPVALSAGVTGNGRRPLGIVTGLALSFTFATVALVYVISALGLPDALLRTVAIVVLLLFGTSLIVPALGDRIEARLSTLGPRLGMRLGVKTSRGGSGLGSGLLVGAGLGFVYAPCAGPILAGVITASASQSFNSGRLAVALAYGIGSAVTLYCLMIGGRRLTGRLVKRSPRFQAGMGIVMVVVAVAMLGNYDTRFETAIASDLPSFIVDPSNGLETSSAATRQLASLRGHSARAAGGKAEADAGLALPVLGTAPGFVDTGNWFNTPGDKPLTLAGLRGHVVLVDFWTYSCINCLRTLPYLNAWYAKYRSDGFVIVGVHTPEFPFEHSASNVAAAIQQNGIQYPVVQDNDYGTWDAYNNEYWPAEYLIDAQGRIRFADFGEGDYATRERAIRSLLIANGASGLGSATHVTAIAPSENETTPESYLGAQRADNFINGTITQGAHDYGSSTATPPDDELRYTGNWTIGVQTAQPGAGAALELNFNARRVYLVAGSPNAPRTLRVLLDGRPITARLAGTDVRNGSATIEFQRLYNLVNLPNVQRHTLTLLPQRGLTAYSFTFG